jgi:hypothetical protein
MHRHLITTQDHKFPSHGTPAYKGKIVSNIGNELEWKEEIILMRARKFGIAYSIKN